MKNGIITIDNMKKIKSYYIMLWGSSDSKDIKEEPSPLNAYVQIHHKRGGVENRIKI